MKNDNLVPFCLLLLGLGISSASNAEMYKWVDEEGVTHYTQSPPPTDIEGETIKPRTGIPASETEKNYKQVKDQLDSLLEKGRPEDTSANEEEGVSDAEYERQVQQACESARKSYQSFQRPRVNLKNPDGTPRVATEEERQAGLEKAQAAINKYCK